IVVFDSNILDMRNNFHLFPAICLEAEDASLSCTAQTDACAQASNGQMVKQVSGGSGNAVEFSGIDIPIAGTYDLVFSYYTATNRNLSYQVNNGAVQTAAIQSSGGWCYQGGNPADHTVSVNLSSGLNTIKVFDTGVLDRIQIKESSVPPFQDMSLEAEDATLSGTAQTASCSQASNGQMVKQLANGSGNAVEFSGIDIPTTGTYDLVFSYYAATARNLSYQLNGGTTQTISVPSTGDWCYQGGSPGDHTISIGLTGGLNTIKVFDAGLLDRIQIKESSASSLTAMVPDEPIVESSIFESVLYPNPLRPNSIFNVQMQGSAPTTSVVTLYDLQGVKVLERTYANHTGTMQVPTGSLAKGLYLVHVRTRGQADKKFKLVVR
ncbi:MAG: T9SS type A sorting domain-containing protein, partial [Flavobacteriaceae bacterium]